MKPNYHLNSLSKAFLTELCGAADRVTNLLTLSSNKPQSNVALYCSIGAVCGAVQMQLWLCLVVLNAVGPVAVGFQESENTIATQSIENHRQTQS